MEVSCEFPKNLTFNQLRLNFVSLKINYRTQAQNINFTKIAVNSIKCQPFYRALTWLNARAGYGYYSDQNFDMFERIN